MRSLPRHAIRIGAVADNLLGGTVQAIRGCVVGTLFGD
jgi:hypothetical protein